MYFEKSNNKKNHKIIFSITLVIILFAAASVVAISSLVITKDVFAADPITSCFIANAIGNPAYLQAVQNFKNSLPNDQVLTKIAASLSLQPQQNNSDLYALLTNPGIDDRQQTAALNEVSNLLTAAGFASLQQQAISFCIKQAV